MPGTDGRHESPHEQNRASTPLELLFGLRFAIACGVAAGLLSFTFSWFAGAYDILNSALHRISGVVVAYVRQLPAFKGSVDGEASGVKQLGFAVFLGGVQFEEVVIMPIVSVGLLTEPPMLNLTLRPAGSATISWVSVPDRARRSSPVTTNFIPFPARG
ncbi:hypothetical protein AOC05_14755 [Arthrobacter alpinus]|uniref:Uncharacterized protein n=1 Tax=Arthrobacter alpinus TaxID=656366 RepID=A0A0M4RQH2_9MICC|nr:hypothetical protein AOC05_14755 [Arthrobacter alpinus]